MIQRARQSPGGTDPYGDPVPGTETLEDIPPPSGYASSFTAPRMSSDIDGPGRAGVIVGLTLFFECGYDLNHDDHVIVPGFRNGGSMAQRGRGLADAARRAVGRAAKAVRGHDAEVTGDGRAGTKAPGTAGAPSGSKKASGKKSAPKTSSSLA